MVTELSVGLAFDETAQSLTFGSEPKGSRPLHFVASEQWQDLGSSAVKLNWDVSSPFVRQMRVGSAHLDGFGHTNNVVYLAWMQDIAWIHSMALGIDREGFYRIGAGCVARRHEMDYLAPTFAGDVLHIGTWITENSGRLDMWRAYQIIRERDGKSILRGRTQWICIDLNSGRPRRQPTEFVSAYQPLATNRYV